MSIAYPTAPSFYASLNCTRAEPAKFLRFSCSTGTCFRRSRLIISSRQNSAMSSGAGGSVSDNGDVQYELQHGISPQRWKESPVFVALPLDVVNSAGQVRRRKAMAQSFRALVAAGVEGLVMEVWWGLVERDTPMVYEWKPYLEIVALARKSELKVRVVMAFHQCGTGPGDPKWIPLPRFVQEVMIKNPEIAYSDRFGRRNSEYISLGCDLLPVLQGRSPMQAYSDFMRSFRDTFRPFLGGIVTGVQVGMGPAGELRYPSCLSQKFVWDWFSREHGEFQCYDKYMLASLNASTISGMQEPDGPSFGNNLMQSLEQTWFVGQDSCWNMLHDNLFLNWYWGMLLLHGERICKETKIIFRGTEVDLSAKVSGVPWHYNRQESHSLEFSSGDYTKVVRDGYLPIVRMLGRYGFTLCCACFEMQDAVGKQFNPVSSSEGFLRQLVRAVRSCGVALQGENASLDLDEKSFQGVVRTSRLYSDGGAEKPFFSFNFMRMRGSLFEYHNWVHFTRFMRQMTSAGIFRARLGFGGGVACLSSAFSTVKAGSAFA